jgi:hypothetical protein
MRPTVLGAAARGPFRGRPAGQRDRRSRARFRPAA